MPNPSSTSRVRLLFTGGVLLAGAVFGLLYLRRTADGLRNAFSFQYWVERRSGFDLYNPTDRYLKRGSRTHHDLLLTFDDAPRAASTPSILKALRDADVTATFFVIGRRVKDRPDLVRDMIANGDEVGNHTQDHLRLDQLAPRQVKAEIKNCEINVERATGRTMTLLRPPGMRLSGDVRQEIGELGYTIVGWNVGAKDFIPDQQVTDMSAEESANLRTTPDQIVDRVLMQVKDGEIILLHDNPVTALALPRMLQELKHRGYRFVSATQMMAELPHPVKLVANPPAPSHLAIRR